MFLINEMVTPHRTSATESFSVLDKPHQPRSFTYLNRTFGKKICVKRSFRSSWYDNWKWLHYNETLDAAFCFYCHKADNEGKLRSNTKEPSFILKLEGCDQGI